MLMQYFFYKLPTFLYYKLSTSGPITSVTRDECVERQTINISHCLIYTVKNAFIIPRYEYKVFYRIWFCYSEFVTCTFIDTLIL